MTARLARLADIAYRRRGRMVLGWIAAMVVIIPLGNSLEGEYNADYNTPGLGVEGGERRAQAALRRLQRRRGRRRLEGRPGRQQPAVQQRINRFLAEAQKVEDIGPPAPTRVSHDGKIAATNLRTDRAALGRPQGERREADRARREGRRQRARDQARRRPDLRSPGAGRSGGIRLSRRDDRAADRVRLGRRRRPAARDRPRRARDLRRADRPARDSSSTSPTGRPRSPD